MPKERFLDAVYGHEFALVSEMVWKGAAVGRARNGLPPREGDSLEEVAVWGTMAVDEAREVEEDDPPAFEDCPSLAELVRSGTG